MLRAAASNAAYAAKMAELVDTEVGVGTRLVSMEAELAAEEAATAAMEASEVIEAAGGPIGWIAMAITGGIILATAVGMVLLMNQIAQSNQTLDDLRNQIKQIPPPQPGPQPQPPGVPKTPLPLPPGAPKLPPLPPLPIPNPFISTDVCWYPYSSPLCHVKRKKFAQNYYV